MFTFLCTLYHLISDEEEEEKQHQQQHLTIVNDEEEESIEKDSKTSTSTVPHHNHMRRFTLVYKLHYLQHMNVSSSTVYFIWSCLVIVLVVHMSKELFQMITYGTRNYFSSIDNWFQLTALFITLASLMPYLPHKLQISIGSFSILFAWICMSLFFQDLEFLSLVKYIVAFR